MAIDHHSLVEVISSLPTAAHLPERSIELVDDNIHLVVPGKGHDGIVASKSARLRQIGY